LKEGFTVQAVAPADQFIERLPCSLIPVKLERSSTNPWNDLLLLQRYTRVFKNLRPFAVLSYTPKPNIYATIAARRVGARTICTVSGLGSGFIRGGPVALVMKALYRYSCHRADTVFFQNQEDLEIFLSRRLVEPGKIDLVPGSGVDIEAFRPEPRKRGDVFVFLMIGRLIRDKGIYEFIEAARSLKARHASDLEFRVLGAIDLGNPGCVHKEEVAGWEAEGVIRYLGWLDDVRPAIADADCVVLPSYREGTPRTLLEAAAMARPAIAADVPGSRQVVENGKTGLLCQVKDSADLAAKMQWMIDRDPAKILQMGLEGRKKMECEFDERQVIRTYIETLNRFKACRKPSTPL
jgi:glycosyltransferase involved in cell wall biosynthesis